MKRKNKQQLKSNVIISPMYNRQSADHAISICIQNLFATYGERKVRESMKELFLMETIKHSKVL